MEEKEKDDGADKYMVLEGNRMKGLGERCEWKGEWAKGRRERERDGNLCEMGMKGGRESWQRKGTQAKGLGEREWKETQAKEEREGNGKEKKRTEDPFIPDGRLEGKNKAV